MKNNPYVGPYSIPEGKKLYGREREVADLSDLLIAERIVLLYSPSGAGKSSLLQAGLLPAMRKRRFTPRPIMRVNAEPPEGSGFDPKDGNRYVLSCLLSIEEQLPKEARKPIEQLARMTFQDYLSDEPNGELLLFDQFEEIITVEPLDYDEKREFFTQLGAVLRNRGRWALFAMREDYLAAMDPYVRQLPTRLTNTFRLNLLERSAALDCIQLPAEEQSVTFAESAANQLTKNLCQIEVQRDGMGETESIDGRYIEPVHLQVTCYRLWENLADGTQEINEIGDLGKSVDEALGAYYSSTVERVAKEKGIPERHVRDWFGKQLITRQGKRGQVMQTEENTAALLPALKPLVDSFLVRQDRRLASFWYELAHDRLLTPVQESNRQWELANLTPFQKQAELWQAENRTKDLLLRGEALSAALVWKETNTLTKTEAALLAESVEAEEIRKREEEAHQREVEQAEALRIKTKDLKRQKQWLYVVLALALAAGVYGWVEAGLAQRTLNDLSKTETARNEALEKAAAAAGQAIDAADQATQDADEALIAKEDAKLLAKIAQEQAELARGGMLAATALTNSARNETAGLLSLEAWKRMQTKETRDALFHAYQLNKQKQLLHHKSGVNQVAFGAEGALVAGCIDGTIWLWDLNAKPPVARQMKADDGAILAIAFNKKGLIASGGASGKIRIWDWKTGSMMGEVEGHNGRVNSLAFDAGGDLLVSGGQDRMVRLWSASPSGGGLKPVAAESKLPKELSADWEVNSVSVSLRDQTLVASYNEPLHSGVWAWRLDRANQRRPVSGCRTADQGFNQTGFADFVEDTRFFIVSWNCAVDVWTSFPNGVSSQRVVNETMEKAGGRIAAALRPRSSEVATGGDDHKVRIWGALASEPRLILQGPETKVRALAFSPDGNTLASVSDNEQAIWLWDVSEKAAAPEGTVLIEGYRSEVNDPSRPTQNVVFDSQAKSMIATGGDKGSTIVSYARNGIRGRWEPVASIQVSAIYHRWRFDLRPSLAISSAPGREVLAVGDALGTALLQSRTLKPIYRLNEPCVVAALALNRKATVLAETCQEPNVLRLYDISDLNRPERIYEEAGPNSWLEGLDISPVEDLLAVGGNPMMGNELNPRDTEVRLIDFSNPKQPVVRAVLPNARARRITFSPDGSMVVVALSGTNVYEVPKAGRKSGPVPNILPKTRFTGHQDWTMTPRFSRDGKMLVSAGANTTVVRLYDPERGIPYDSDLNLPVQADVAAFDPLTKQLVLFNGKGQLWGVEMDPDVWIREICSRVNRNMTQAEWRRFIGTSYSKTCPSLPAGE